MKHNRTNNDLYDVRTYTDEELYNVLELNNPSDRELEAKILLMVNKYTRMGGDAADKLAQFFIDIYSHFFDISDDEEESGRVKEGFQGASSQPEDIPGNVQIKSGKVEFKQFNGNTQVLDVNGNVSGKTKTPQIQQTNAVDSVITKGVLDITKNDRQTGGAALTRALDYSKDTLNPLLKQTIKRVISIDSQYRENKKSSSTEFTFNLSEPLRDVVSLKLYSIQIPYTWYTINSSFGGNFFYIKGNVDGINNGNHDYLVKIASGNYSPSTLIGNIQAAITNLPMTYPDVSFGNTSISYNSATVKTTININLKEVFNESNYYLDFPNWSSPLSDSARLTTLAGYFGYNNSTNSTTRYPVHMAYSQRILPLTGNDSPNLFFTIGPSNNTLYVYPYTVSDTSQLDYTSNSSQVYTPYIITIGQGIYTRPALMEAVNAQILANPNFDSRYSFMSRVDISNNGQFGDRNSYFKISIKLTQKAAQSIEGLKCTLVLPNDIVWVGSSLQTSCFCFSKTTHELSDIYSETPVLQSKYIINPTTDTSYNRIRFECIATEYKHPSNDYVIDLSASPSAGYILDNYILEINNSILKKNTATTYPNSNQLSLTNTIGTYMEITSTRNIKFNVYINKNFDSYYYTVQFYGAGLCDLFKVVSGNVYDLSSTHIFTGFDRSTTFESNKDRIVITPTFKFGQTAPEAFTIWMVDGSGNFTTLDNSSKYIPYINGRISSYIDNQGRNPISSSGASIQYVDGTPTPVLTINVSKQLTYSDYKLVFESNQPPATTISNPKNNTWIDYLDFDASYNFDTYTNNSALTTYITNKSPKYSYQITLVEGVNNYFYIRSFPDIDGLTSTGVYDISVNVLPGEYTIDELYTQINSQLQSNELTAGSLISKTVDGYTKLRLNINKVFRAKDYSLVFYDQYSFVSCYTGASHTGNKSVQNATWDTTVGWILGFRENIIYSLIDYQPAPNTDTIYFSDAGRQSNCVLTGDTTVSTNLYNYFLIGLDDYTQNHLNDGLVTITTQETSINVGAYTYVCDPYATSGSTMVAVPASKAHDGSYKSMTQAELYAFNQKVLSKKIKDKSYSKGPFVKDIFGIIPMKTAGLANGSSYVEFGGTLQNQERMYFGPVNIHRMTIQLLNDRGDLVDLNNSNWSFSLVCEQLYKSNT